MDDSGFDYQRWENALCDLLEHHGWIKSIESNRNDTLITWTPKGKKCGERFIEEVCALPRDEAWTESDLVRLRGFGQYLGFIEKTRRDRTQDLTGPYIGNRDLLVVTTTATRSQRFRLFSKQTFDGFYDYLESEHDAGSEIMMILIDHILESNVDRASSSAAEIDARAFQDQDLIVVATSTGKDRSCHLFSEQTSGDILETIETERDCGNECVVISISAILASNVGRAFPFGAADSPGTIWSRGKVAPSGRRKSRGKEAPSGWRKWFSSWL